MTDTRRRVKVYTCDEDRPWDDLGTGHVSVGYVDHLKGLSVIVRAESDGSLLLESKINPNNDFHKQEETLIMWSEDKIYDVALSFQQTAVCDEIWEKICQAQGKNHSEDITQDILDRTDEDCCADRSSLAQELPPCKLNCLEDLAELVASSVPSLLRREKLALAVEEEGYIHKLLEIFRLCEDLDNREGLHHLYKIIKGMFLLNRRALFEIMLSDECIMDIIGCLEFDPALAQPLQHREFLNKMAQFKEVIPISDPDLRQIIHQTYRVQYIQDIVLPAISCFQENTPSALNSFICFNKVEIVGMLQGDEKFLTDLFAQLSDEATEDGKKRELVDFLKELCALSQMLQVQHRRAFFKTLSKKGILPTLKVILRMDDAHVRRAATDILSNLVECNPSMVQEFVVLESQQNNDDILLIDLIIQRVTCDPELGGAEQFVGLLQTLVDPENMLGSANKIRKTEFLNFFYKNCMPLLSAPLLANATEGNPNKDDFQTSQVLALILELFTFCVEHHTYHIRNFVINKDILRKVLVLTVSQHAFLALSALRFMRRIIGLKDEFYYGYIMRNFLFEPVIKVFLENGSRYNLMNSALIEMFEYIRVENVKSLTAHIVENYWKFLESVDYVKTFKGLKLRYEQRREREANPKVDRMHSILRNHRFHRDTRTLEYEKEMGFKGDEDNFKFSKVVVLPSHKVNSEEDLTESIKKYMERKELEDSKGDEGVLGDSRFFDEQNPGYRISFSSSPKTNFSRPPSFTPIMQSSQGSPDSPGAWAQSSTCTAMVTPKGGLVGLVDYLDDDDEEEGEVKDDPLPSSKKSKLSS